MTENEIEDFIIKNAPALAEDITALCGQVITKGIQGILHQCCDMQLRQSELETALRETLEICREWETDYASGEVRNTLARAQALLKPNVKLTGSALLRSPVERKVRGG